MIENKKIIIDKYISNITTFDLFSETYRWWKEQKLYLPLSYNYIFSKWEDFIKMNPDWVIDLYIHIPFCLKLCSYCNYYKTLVEENSLDKYVLDYLIPYLQNISIIFEWFKFNSLYIWWWTPSIIGLKLLEKLLSFIENNILFVEWAEKTFEWNPISLSEKKIEILSKYWINRVSMGVQTLNNKVLIKTNREYQNLEIIKKVINKLNNFWISNINIDLLIWLDNNEKDDFIYSLWVFSKLNISLITTYWLTPTSSYLLKHFSWDKNMFYANLNNQINSIYDELTKIISKFKFESYNISKLSNHCWQFTIKNCNTKTSYTDIWNNSILWIWPSSRSYINWSLVYLTLEYIPINFNIKFVDNLWKKINSYDEMLLYTIINVRDNWFINTDYIYKNFSLDFKNIFSQEIEFLLKFNYITIKDNNFIFSENVNKKYYSILFLFDLIKLDIKDFLNSKEKRGNYITLSSNNIELILNIKNDNVFIFVDKEKININNIYRYYFVILNIKKIYEKFNKYIFSLLDFYNILNKYFSKKNKDLNVFLNYTSK